MIFRVASTPCSLYHFGTVRLQDSVIGHRRYPEEDFVRYAVNGFLNVNFAWQVFRNFRRTEGHPPVPAGSRSVHPAGYKG